MAKESRVLPNNLEAEQCLLGCVLIDTKWQGEILAGLTPDDFFYESNKTVFEAVFEMYKKSKNIDVVTLADELERRGKLQAVGGVPFLTELTLSIPATENYKYYKDIVLRDSVHRKLIRGARDIAESAYKSADKNATLAHALEVITKISEGIDSSMFSELGDVVTGVLKDYDEALKNGGAKKGLLTGLKELDDITNGFQNSDLIILAARPAVGKTAFALNIVEYAALHGNVCAVFSLEMSKSQLAARLISGASGVSGERAKRGELSQKDLEKLYEASYALSGTKVYLDDNAMITPQEIISKCKRLKLSKGLHLVVIDYLQLIMAAESGEKRESRQQEVSDISRLLKIMAKELNVPVIALSQLNRDVSKSARKPMISDLRESGSIEQDADIVMFLHEPEGNDKNANIKNIQLLIEKHRNGRTGEIDLVFKKNITKFFCASDNAVTILGEKKEAVIEDNGEEPKPPEDLPF